jgi:phosphatidylglycerophosphate synthase
VRIALTCLLLVPAKYHENLLEQKIAGLSLAQRLFHHRQRSGIERLILSVTDDRELSSFKELEGCLVRDYSGLENAGFDRCIVCRPGILPDIKCLKWLKRAEIKDNEIMELQQGIFVFPPSGQGFELKKAFERDGYFRLLNFLHTFLTKRPAICENGRIFDLTGPENAGRVEKILFHSLIKDTEGFMSRFLERRISLAISRQLVNTSITPNQITMISTFIGLTGAYLISMREGLLQILGSILFLVHSIVDGCDGEIARIKFKESRIGGVLDFWSDNIVHAAVFAAIGTEWWRRTGAIAPLYLSATAVLGTFLSAMLIYLSTMKKKVSEGPLYTSVSRSGRKARIVKIADFLSRRDFIYLVVVLAFYQHLDWFLVAAAAGTMVFLAMLVWIRVRD